MQIHPGGIIIKLFSEFDIQFRTVLVRRVLTEGKRSMAGKFS